MFVVMNMVLGKSELMNFSIEMIAPDMVFSCWRFTGISRRSNRFIEHGKGTRLGAFFHGLKRVSLICLNQSLSEHEVPFPLVVHGVRHRRRGAKPWTVAFTSGRQAESRSFWEEKNHAYVRLSEEVATMESLAPTNVMCPCIRQIGGTPVALATETPAPFSDRRARRSVRPLNRRGISVLVLPNSKKRMLHRSFSRMVSPAEKEATYDWASITGLALGVLALALIDSGSILMVWFGCWVWDFPCTGDSEPETETCVAGDWQSGESSSLASAHWPFLWEWSLGSSGYSNLDPIFIQMTESTPHQAVLQGSPLLAKIRMTFIMLTILILVLLSLLLRLVFIFSQASLPPIQRRFVIYPFSRLLMRIVGIKLVVEGKMPSSRHLIVSNHQGVVDSLLLMALSPCMVISNSLIRDMKGIGAVMELLGFVFVDRTRRKSIVELLQPAIRMMAQSKVNMGFFPEGKSSDGIELFPFHSPFFKIAIDSNSGVQPLAFRWTHTNGHPLSPAQRLTYTYLVKHGSVVEHLSNLLGLRKKVLVVKVLEPISVEEIAEKNWTRKEVAQRSEDLIREAMNDDAGW